MKKILLFASALAGLFLAASCQQESLEPVGVNTVTYTVQVPDAIATKAIGDNVAAVTELVYEVYRTEATSADDYGQNETKLYQKTATITDGEATVELELVNNQNFRILFWAQVPGNGVYNTESLKNVTLAQSLNANAENYNAFAGADYLKDGDVLTGRTIKLVRPVAQLNIATTAESLKLGEDANGENAQTEVEVKTSYVKVTGLSTSYNVAEGLAADDESVFEYAAKPVVLTEPTITVNSTPYTYLAMNYVGFAAKPSSTVTVDYTIATENVGDITNTISNVPVKANYRTNIIGNLITSTSDYKVTLDAEWGTPDENVVVSAVSTASALQEAINAIPDGVEGNITLTDDIDLSALASMISTKAGAPTYGLLIPAGKAVVLDLNGCTLSQTVEQTGAYSMILNKGTLTIDDSKGNGKISYADSGNGGEYISDAIYNNSVLVINGGTIENLSSATVASNGYPHAVDTYSGIGNTSVTINGGTIYCAEYSAVRMFCVSATNTADLVINGGTIKGAVDMQNGTKVAAVGTLTINDGTFQTTKNANNIRFANWNGGATEYGLTAAIKGGSFNGGIQTKYVPEAANWNKGIITGGTFAVDPSEYVAEGYGVVANENGTFTVEKLPTVAKIGDTEYLSLGEAVKYVQEGETITILEGTIEEGTIKLPASLKNVTFKGEEGAVLKDMTVMSHDGNSISYEGLTFDGLTLDNSRISITGWRTNGAVVKNFTVTNCIFRNLDDNTNSAPLHINMDANEAVNGLTFTNNVIDGATGGSKSGIYAQVTGEVLVSGNVINNVSFRPYVIQVTTDDGVADNFIVTENTFSGSVAGRAQGLGNNDEGTDAVTIVVSDNIFKGITDAQQICYWNFNDATTEFDLSGNYYDIDILANPSRIYYNGAASGLADLIAKNIFPIYTELNADGTINKDSSYTPSTVAKIGDVEYYSLQEAVDAADDGATIIFLKDVEQVDGVLITNKNNLTVDLNEKTFTVSEGASTNNRNFKINGSSVVTIKNGTMVAKGDIKSGTYGTVRTEDSANVILNKVASYSYRGYGLNVKACTGTKITINDSEIYAQYSGGVEAAGGEIELNNVKIVQNGVDSSGAWCSVAIGVNGGGKVTVNSGEYSAAAISTDSNAAQGTWVAYVMSSGGTLDIKGGTFNGTVAETAAAANACGLICADTKAVVNIYEGTFTSNGAILDMRNNTGGSPNPVATLYGGKFSADPRVSGLYGSNLISVAEGMEVKKGADDRWILVKVQPNNEIWYTSAYNQNPSNHYIVTPTTEDAFGNAIYKGSSYDEELGVGIITFDKELTTIGNEAFKRNTNTTPSNWMTTVSIPNSVTSIGNYAFAQCFSLTSITIPDSVTTIGQYAFQSCNAATSVTIGSGVTSIGSGAFYNSYEINRITCKSTTPPTIADKWVFYGIDTNITVIVPAGSVDAYKAADFWKNFKNIVAE